MPLHHVSLPTADLEATTAFYLKALKPLGYQVFMKIPETVGLGPPMGDPDFWMHKCPVKDKEGVSKTHVAFSAKSQAQVKRFYEAALAAGAKDNGAPGERKYTKGYYAAYVLDPEGNNVECVYYQPWWLSAIQVAPYVLPAVGAAGIAFWGGQGGFAAVARAAGLAGCDSCYFK